MRRKDGQPKLKSLRAKARIQWGFRNNPHLSEILNPALVPGNETTHHFSCVSLFSGCGGLDLGFLGGFRIFGQLHAALPTRILAAYDFDDQCIETYRLNLGPHGIRADLSLMPADKIPAAQVLLGGFPCQDFSSCGPKKGLEGKRGRLYEVMASYMQLHKPLIVIGENVPFFEKLHDGVIMRTVIKDFEKCGYRFNVWRIRCQDFGLPQSRTRIFLVGVRTDLSGRPMEPTPPIFTPRRTIDQAIDDLLDIRDETIPNQSQYFVATKATKGAGQGDQKCQAGDISFTIRANARGRIQFHHSLDRRLTVRECARLQSFPDEFVFPHGTQTNLSQIGNAVPPIIGHLVGQSVVRYLTAATREMAA